MNHMRAIWHQPLKEITFFFVYQIKKHLKISLNIKSTVFLCN